jgi:hypothetical protein
MPIYLKGNKLLTNNIPSLIDKTIIPNYINSSIVSRLSGKNPSTDRFVYSSQNPYGGVGDAGIWVRNPNCWINGVSNISCFSPAQLSGASWNTRAGTLITRKHVLFAKHYTTSILSGGTPIIFVDENNNAIRRNIIQYEYDTSDSGSGTDIAVALLDSEVPSNIKIAKVLAPDFGNYIDTSPVSSIFGSGAFRPNPYLYAVGLDQEEKAIVKLWTGAGLWISGNGADQILFQLAGAANIDPNATYTPPINPPPQQFASWSEAIVVGDSGNPLFLIIDNELVVLTTWWTVDAGPFITNRYTQVNNIIESLSPGEDYSLTPIDLQAVYAKYYPRSFRCIHQ